MAEVVPVTKYHARCDEHYPPWVAPFDSPAEAEDALALHVRQHHPELVHPDQGTSIEDFVRRLMPVELADKFPEQLSPEDRRAIARVIVDAMVCGNGFLSFWADARNFERYDPATVVLHDARL